MKSKRQAAKKTTVAARKKQFSLHEIKCERYRVWPFESWIAIKVGRKGGIFGQ